MFQSIASSNHYNIARTHSILMMLILPELAVLYVIVLLAFKTDKYNRSAAKTY